MAIQYICDGCDSPMEEKDAKKFGRVIFRHYCPACSTKAQKYADDLDKVHDAAATVWEQGSTELREQQDLKRLPDHE